MYVSQVRCNGAMCLLRGIADVVYSRMHECAHRDVSVWG